VVRQRRAELCGDVSINSIVGDDVAAVEAQTC